MCHFPKNKSSIFNSPFFQFQHDTGAPLMCLDSAGSWKLSGILSHEGECLTRSHPDVFTSVVELSDWISKTIGRRMS